MKQLAMLLCLAGAGLLFTPPLARAADTEARDICVCRQVIARTLCKPPEEVEFIDRFMDTTNYSFTVFYAKKQERFICNVSGNEIRIKGNAWTPILRTVTVQPDLETGCVDLGYFVPECPRAPVRCCAPVSREDEEERKALEFWSRPIPELLEEELRTGIAREANATRNGQPEEDANTP